MNGPDDSDPIKKVPPGEGKHWVTKEEMMRELMSKGLAKKYLGPDEAQPDPQTATQVRNMQPPGPGAMVPPPPPQYNPAFAPPHRYRDADDFDRETGGHDVCHIIDIDHNFDWLKVHNQVSGITYRMTLQQAIARGMGPYAPGEQFTLNGGRCMIGDHPVHRIAVDPSGPIQDATKVHIVYQGQPMCHFTSLRLVDWPKGHQWASLQAFKDGASVTCKECAAAATAILKNAP